MIVFSIPSPYLRITGLDPSLYLNMQTSSYMADGDKDQDHGSAKPDAVTFPRGSAYQLQKLRANHHLIIQLAATGLKNKEIAKRVGCTEQTVHYTLNSELGQQQLSVLLGKTEMASMDITKMFQELSPIALEVIEEIMLSEWATHANKLKAAERILDGAGHGKRTHVDVDVRHFTDADIIEAKRIAKAKIMDAFYTVEDAQLVTDNDEPKRIEANVKRKRDS